MIRRRLWISIIGIVTIAVLALGANLLGDNRPVLGLDLQGGVSVVLSTEDGASGDDLVVIRDLIRDELENRGIAEPDVRVEGQNVIVDLPGVRDQREALDAVDVAGIVSLRPVLSPCTEIAPEAVADGSGSTVPGSSVPGSSVPGSSVPGSSEPESSVPGSTAVASIADSVSESSAATRAGPQGLRRVAAETSAAETSAAETSAPGTTAATETSTATTAATVTTEPAEASDSTAPESSEPGPTTTTLAPLGPLGDNPVVTYPATPFGPPPPPPEDTIAELQSRDGLTCVVGPVERDATGGTGGQVFSRGSAEAVLDQSQGWIVNVTLTTEGRGTFNSLANACFTRAQNCPTGQIAIVLDDIVQSAPVVNQQDFTSGVTISGTFSESDARSLARVLNRGAFPVQVRTESVQTISPTLGEDSMRASVFAGLTGIALVLVGLLYFYRRLIVVVLAGLAVWGLLIYSASAIVSRTTNYALTLAGVTGIIVAIGITVDSYVVYFERLKEEVRHGRTIRNAAPRSFKSTWRTILAADFVSLMAAAVLFSLSIGSVRGFALYLGITTVCDVVVCWFFTRPAVILLADSGWLDEGDTFGLKDYEVIEQQA